MPVKGAAVGVERDLGATGSEDGANIVLDEKVENTPVTQLHIQNPSSSFLSHKQ